MTAPVSFGIVGTGRMAATMAATLAGVPGVRLAAVASRSAERAGAFAARFAIPRACGSLAEICAAPDVDILYVANATEDHAATCLEILAAGRHVLCEKPFALDAGQARAVAGAAAASGRFFMEALWPLALPAYARLKALAGDGTLGVPRHLRFDFGYPVHEADLPGLTAPERGGVLFDRGCYGVALALWLLGPAARVGAAAFGPGGGAVLRLRHGGEALSEIAVSTDCLLSNTAWLACSGGLVGLGPPSLAAESLRIRPMAPARLQAPGPRDLRRALRGLPALRRLRDSLGGGAGRHEWLSYGRDPYAPMIAHVRDCLAAGRTGSALVPLSLSVATVEALAAAAEDLAG